MLEPRKGYLVTCNLNGSTLTLPCDRVERDETGSWNRVYFAGVTLPYHRHEIVAVCRPSR